MHGMARQGDSSAGSNKSREKKGEKREGKGKGKKRKEELSNGLLPSSW